MKLAFSPSKTTEEEFGNIEARNAKLQLIPIFQGLAELVVFEGKRLLNGAIVHRKAICVCSGGGLLICFPKNDVQMLFVFKTYRSAVALAESLP